MASENPTHKAQELSKSGEIDLAALEKNVSNSFGTVETPTQPSRDLGLLAIVSIGWNICNSWAAIAATLAISVASGGPVTLIYGIMIIFIFGAACALSMAEIASVHPTAGGQYHWTSILAPESASRGLSYWCGAVNVFGWIATSAGFIITFPTMALALASFWNPGYTVATWHVFLIFQAMNFLMVAYNIFLLKRTIWLQDVGFFLSLIAFFVITITCLAESNPKQSSDFVWREFVNTSGWSSDGVVFLTGLVNPNFIFSGLDGAIHLAEECTNAAVAVPRALVSTVVIGFVTALVFAIGMCYSYHDFDAVLASPFPALEIWYQATSSPAVASFFLVTLNVITLFAISGAIQTASRLTWSFARDDAVVFAPFLSRIHPRWGVPVWSLIANSACVFVLGCVYLGSSTAFNALVSTGIILQQLSFAFPAALMLYRRVKGTLEEVMPQAKIGFKLRFGIGPVANVLTIIMALLALVFYDLPVVLPVTVGNMNYACAVIGVMGLLALANWYLLTLVSTEMPSFPWKKLRRSKAPINKHGGQVQLGPSASTTSQATDRVGTPSSHGPSQAKKARDLWSEAFASLNQNDREILRLDAGDGTPVDDASQTAMVQKVRELTEAKYEEHCTRGRYTKKGDTTQETNIRVKAQEIMCATLQFDGIVKAGLKFDPSGYGTTVWGVLSGVLTLVQNDKDRADAVFDSAAVLARFLPKYAIIEAHYLDRETQEQRLFEDQIRDVYTCILNYAACVQKELNRSRAARVLVSFWSLDNQDIKILKDELEASDKRVTEQSSFVAHQYRIQEFQKLDTKASEALDKIDIFVRQLLKDEKLRTLKWLSDSSIMDKQQQLRSKVEKLNKGSGKWFLKSEEYKSWLTSPHSFLRLYGTSGCGKSMLCSTVVKDLVDSAAENSNMVVAYRYFDNADPQTQSIQGLIRLILRRISAKTMPVPGPVHDLATRHEAAGSTPGTAALIKTLRETVTVLEEDLYLVLDAIDEYQTGNETVREEFLDFLVEMGDAKMHNLHILVTHVPEPYIKDAFMRLKLPPASMDVEMPVSVDVDAYLDTTINKYATDKKWSSEIRTKIEQTLKKDGRFRIVSLQLEDLRNCYDDEEVVAALESIPQSIEEAYVRKLRNVAPKDVRRLRHIFSWISVATRQLTTSELAAAPGVELHNPGDLSSICPSGMIRMEKQYSSSQHRPNTEADLVTFDHPSVKRFLLSSNLQDSTDNRLSPFFVSEEAVNTEFARLMIDKLLAVEQPLKPSTCETMPFLPYAARYWHEHLRHGANTLDEEEQLKSKLLTLFKYPMSPCYLNWIRMWDPERKRTNLKLKEKNCPSPLYMAVFLGLQCVSIGLIEKHSYINGNGGLMHTTLQLASMREDIEISQKLIASGEDIDRTSGDQPVALQLASFRGSTSMVRLLVASGADVNLRSGSFGTALQAAAAVGHTEIVAILLDKGAETDIVDGMFGTAIQAAETGGHSEVVKLIAARGVAWDEEGDSVWREAYDQCSPSPMDRAAKFLALNKVSTLSETQRMLASALKLLDVQIPNASNDFKVEEESTDPKEEAAHTKRLKLTAGAQRSGQTGIENKYYAYRALFWAIMFHCKAAAAGHTGKRNHDFDQKLNRLSDTIFQLASVQKIIEHDTSDELLAARHELTKCYAMAFDLVCRASQKLRLETRLESGPAMARIKHHVVLLSWNRMMGEFQRQREKFESVMRMSRLQEPSDAHIVTEGSGTDTANKMQHTLLEESQQCILESFQSPEEDVQKSLAGLEQRVLESVRDMLPAIIREEMHKLLAEQRKDAKM